MKFYDTSALLDLGTAVLAEHFLIAGTTLYELEDIKTSGKKDESTKAKARTVTRMLAENPAAYTVVMIDPLVAVSIMETYLIKDNNDGWIMAAARDYLNSLQSAKKDAENVKGTVGPFERAAADELLQKTTQDVDSFQFVTSDLSCLNLAKHVMKLPTEYTFPDVAHNQIQQYKGWTETTLADGGEEAMAMAYQTHDEGYIYKNLFDTPLNGYLIVRDPDTATDDNPAGDAVGWLRWNGKKYVPVKYKKISNRFTGDIKPLNDQQKLAFDMLQNDDITVKMLAGTFGSGKTMLMVSSAIDMIEKHKFDKLIWIRNNIEVKNTKELGALPGTLLDKLGAASFAGPLADHLGGEAGLEYWINNGQVEVAHLGFIRGRDYKNSILMVSEAENLTKEHVQLLLGRVGEGSMLWLDGDLKQTDEAVFENNSGMRKAIQCLAGDPHFGYVYLNKTERSETAQLADLLD